MRIGLRIIITAVALVMVSSLLPAASAAPQPTASAAATVTSSRVTASAAPVVPAALFGQHVGRIVQGKPGTLLRVGSIRLWDSGVTWRAIEVADNSYRWARLDAAVKHAQELGASEIMLTLGSTPRWAASDPNSKLGLYGPGSNSHPKTDKLYLDYLKAVAQRYKGRITAYQVWNEANLRDFYLGTPKQMANLTKQAHAVLKSVDPRAKLVAASTTVREKGPVGKFGKAYGAEMRKVGWPVDAVSAHFYPPATKGPATRVSYIKTVKKYYAKYGAKKKPLWDTEMNYGDTRSYMKVKKVYTGETARTYVARTFLDSMRYGVSRVFWYGWDMHMLGTDMTNRTNSGVSAGGATFLKMQEWMVGKSWLGCKTKAKVTTCKLRARDGSVTAIRWSSKVKKYKVPKGVTAIHLLNGSVQPVAKGQKVQLTAQPVAMTGPKP